MTESMFSKQGASRACALSDQAPADDEFQYFDVYMGTRQKYDLFSFIFTMLFRENRICTYTAKECVLISEECN